MTVLPESALPRCLVCGSVFDPIGPASSRVLREVVGYTRPRDQGGANHIIARRETGRLVGPCCAERVQAGVSTQEALL